MSKVREKISGLSDNGTPGQGSSGNSGRTRGTADGQFAGSPDLSGNVKQPVSDGGRLLPQ